MSLPRFAATATPILTMLDGSVDTMPHDKEKRKPPKASDYLDGKSPHARAEEKRRRCVDWLYRWGYSSGPVLARVAGAQQAIVGKLERAGLVVQTRTEAGGITRGTPAFFYTLSELGLQLAERLTDRLLRYPEEDRYKVNQQQIRHYLLAQVATIDALDSGGVIDYATERQLDDAGIAGAKHPDVVWTLPGGGQIGIEVELSAKWDRRLDELVSAVERSLTANHPTPARFKRIAIVSDSPAILRRYREAMQPNAPLAIWKRNARQHWEVERTTVVPAWLIERVDFMLLEDA